MRCVIDLLAPTTLATSRLRLRPPTRDDAGFVQALHSDPATYTHAPWAHTTDPAHHRLTHELWLEHWREEGFGYWVVEQVEGGRAIGACGVRRQRAHPGELNLYYRFTAGSHGQGYGTEAARAAVSWAAQWLPDDVVVAVIRPENVASQRTAARSGLSRVGMRDVPGDPEGVGPSELWRAPVVRREEPNDELFGQMLDLWCRVNAAGGAVGFLPDSPREAVAEVLSRELARTSDDVPLVVLRDAADARLLGFCWWVRDPFALFAHSLTLKRLMVDPAEQGRGLGSILLGGATAVARTMPDVDLLRLHYRSGLGLGRFYAAHGWAEVGRVPRLIRVAPDDLRDSVEMARRPDGSPLVPDGRL